MSFFVFTQYRLSDVFSHGQVLDYETTNHSRRKHIVECLGCMQSGNSGLKRRNSRRVNSLLVVVSRDA